MISRSNSGKLSWLKDCFLIFFLVAVLAPGLVLGIFAFRSLQQDRHLAERQLSERVGDAAERAALRMKEEWHSLEAAAEEIATANDPENHAERYAELGIIVIADEGRIVRPPGSLAFDLAPELKPLGGNPSPSRFEALEKMEFRGQNLALVLNSYEKALKSELQPLEQAWLRHRIGRTLLKLGRSEEALSVFRQLSSSAVSVAGLPAELLARFEICKILERETDKNRLVQEAARLYEDLVCAAWDPLPRERYLFYSQTLKNWLGPHAPVEDVAREQERLHLTETAAEAMRGGGPYLNKGQDMLSAVTSTFSESRVVLLLTRNYFEERLWPKLEVVRDADLTLSLVDARGELLLGRVGVESRWTATRNLSELRLPWRILASPREPNQIMEPLRLRQNLYLGLLVMVMGLLCVGGYLAARTIRREQEVSRMKSDFVATVSHEFRSPLTGIRQLAEMLEEGRVKNEDKKHEYYGLICRESNRLGRLVENILDFSRIEEGRKEFQFEPIVTQDWLNAVIESFKSRRQIETRIADKLPKIWGDREALTSAIGNLIDNAIKYSDSEDPVRIDASTRDGWVSISVVDWGHGIPSENQDRIFEKFYRGEREPSPKVKGVGLGLALVKSIIEAHGGQVTARSNDARGSTFTVTLEAAKS